MEMRNLATYSNRPNPSDTERGVSHMDVARLLLDKGADPNAAYVKTIPPRQAQGNINVAPGATPLYRAVRAIDLAAVQLLADRGADPSQAIKDGSTPLMAAAGLGAPRGGDEEVTEAGDRNDPIDVMKVLIAKGANVNAANDAGMTPLHYAAQRGVGSHHRIPRQPGGAIRREEQAGTFAVRARSRQDCRAHEQARSRQRHNATVDRLRRRRLLDTAATTRPATLSESPSSAHAPAHPDRVTNRSDRR